MSNLVEIKKRITSITSTIKVTKVMQMIATAKIAKIKQLIPISEKYNNYANEILSSYLKYSADSDNLNKYFNEDKQDNKSVLFILMSSDKGTCGSINTTIFKEMHNLIKEYKNNSYNITILPMGKKANKWVAENSEKLNIKKYNNPLVVDAENCNSYAINTMLQDMVQKYDNNEYSKIVLVYHKFKNIITFNSVSEVLLPFNKEALDVKNAKFTNINEGDLEVSALIEFLIRTKVYNAYLSNLSSVVASRMNAMDNATKNGQEIIDELRIKYNKGRQASITAELSDIVSGFEAIS